MYVGRRSPVATINGSFYNYCTHSLQDGCKASLEVPLSLLRLWSTTTTSPSSRLTAGLSSCSMVTLYRFRAFLGRKTSPAKPTQSQRVVIITMVKGSDLRAYLVHFQTSRKRTPLLFVAIVTQPGDSRIGIISASRRKSVNGERKNKFSVLN